MTNEAFARIKIDALLKDAGWRLTDGLSVRYEYPLDDGRRADYALFDQLERTLLVGCLKQSARQFAPGLTYCIAIACIRVGTKVNGVVDKYLRVTGNMCDQNDKNCH